jgi:hypothetical protein
VIVNELSAYHDTITINIIIKIKNVMNINRQMREKKNKLEEDSKEHYKKFWDSFLIRTPINLVNQEMK